MYLKFSCLKKSNIHHLSLRSLGQSKWLESQCLLLDTVTTSLANIDIIVKNGLTGCQLLNQGLTLLESVKLCNYQHLAILTVQTIPALRTSSFIEQNSYRSFVPEKIFYVLSFPYPFSFTYQKQNCSSIIQVLLTQETEFMRSENNFKKGGKHGPTKVNYNGDSISSKPITIGLIKCD